MHTDDTIVAVSSPPGAGLRGIVRASGPAAFAVAATLTNTDMGSPVPRALDTMLRDPRLPCRLLAFRSPRSFTGQDIVEFHIPGSPALLRMLVDQALRVGGVRLAEPGEFSARAFFNRKIDLTEAEGIAAAIAAATERQLRAAASLRQGALHSWTARTADALADLLARVEAGIDFVEEEGVTFLTPQQATASLESLHRTVTDLLASAARWERLDALPTVVFTGRPNVGKSSLLNALTGTARAIVSPVAGTTRDALSATMVTAAGPIRLVDVAGEEPSGGSMSDRMNAAREAALRDADAVVGVDSPHDYAPWMYGPAADAPPGAVPWWPHVRDVPVLLVHNKSDLLRPLLPNQVHLTPVGEPLCVSAATGENLDALRAWIVQTVARREAGGAMVLNRRHREALRRAADHLAVAQEWAAGHPELLAAELRHALDALGEISGTIAPDEILGRIFGQFCIGK